MSKNSPKNIITPLMQAALEDARRTNSQTITITRAMAKTAFGWTKKRLRALGEPWPQIKGWQNRIIGKRINIKMFEGGHFQDMGEQTGWVPSEADIDHEECLQPERHRPVGHREVALCRIDSTFYSINLDTGEILPITVSGPPGAANITDTFRPVPRNGFKLGVNCTSIYRGDAAPW